LLQQKVLCTIITFITEYLIGLPRPNNSVNTIQ
jgi:hypothetical protein